MGTSQQRPLSAGQRQGALRAQAARLEGLLEGQLHDPRLARRLARLVVEEVLQWTPPTGGFTGVAGIIACAFGCRRSPRGQLQPGPVNAALAQVTLDLHGRTASPVYAQWEIAEAIGRRIPAPRLHCIRPELNSDGSAGTYLSTFGVMAQAASLMGRDRARKRILIVGHRDHVFRCVRIARRLGLARAVAPAIPLPGFYDARSAQPWTRDRLAYLLHDVLCRIEAYREEVTGGSSPSRQLD